MQNDCSMVLFRPDLFYLAVFHDFYCCILTQTQLKPDRVLNYSPSTQEEQQCLQLSYETLKDLTKFEPLK